MDEHEAAVAAPETTEELPTIWRVDDALWAELRPLLIVEKPRKKPGRPRRDDRAIFDGLIWIARSGGQWAALPGEFGPKSTVHDRFQEWVEHGCFAPAWARFLSAYDGDVGIDWAWQAADGCIVKGPLGKKGGRRGGGDRGQPDRGKGGTKRHLLTDGRGVPLAVVVTGANRTDMKKLADLLDAQVYAAPAAEGERHLCLDQGYDYAACPRAAKPSRCRRPATPTATRPGAGWSRSGIAGSTASGGCSSAGRRRPRTTSPSSRSPPS